MMDTTDCLGCGSPMCDHIDVPLRYVLRCWRRHRVETCRERVARKLDRWILLTEWF